VTTISQTVYDGPCPVTIKLEGAVMFDVARNNQENYAYHWATGDQQLTDDVKAFSKGRTNHVESSIQLQEPVGVPATIPSACTPINSCRRVRLNFSATRNPTGTISWRITLRSLQI
jgi:hypothetical protein